MAQPTSPYQRLLERRAIPGKTIALSERFNSLQEQDDIKYLLASMEPMDPDYTETTLSEARRVYGYLESFSAIRIQGSVTTNTHIRYYSDVDILSMTPDFEQYEGGLPGTISRYQGDAIQTLKNLRNRSRSTIALNFPAVKIEEKDRALGLSGGSLRRKVDVVTANWYNTIAYESSRDEKDRGVQILDVGTNSRVLNKPFLHQHLIRQKNAITNEGACRAIRMLKTLKMDADSKIDISSYDICALVWNMDSARLPGSEKASFILAKSVCNALLAWVINEPSLNSLMVPNQTRLIIDAKEGTSLVAVRSLWYELHLLLQRIEAAGKKSDKDLYVVGNNLYQF